MPEPSAVRTQVAPVQRMPLALGTCEVLLKGCCVRARLLPTRRERESPSPADLPGLGLGTGRRLQRHAVRASRGGRARPGRYRHRAASDRRLGSLVLLRGALERCVRRVSRSPPGKCVPHGGRLRTPLVDRERQRESGWPRARRQRDRQLRRAGGRGDRKSTRLNSSHLVISYAVFFLKKKKRG